jgi:regulator of protease activity HflC (stomatin/prohibitin superfamily)
MNWLLEIINKITSFIPRPVIIEPDEMGIRLTPKPLGNVWIKDLKPGIYIWVPLFQVVRKVVVVTQVTDLKNQCVRTKDGCSVVVSGAVQYRIAEVRKSLLNVHDADKGIQVLALGIIAEYIKSKTLEECQDYDALKEEIRKNLAEAMSNWGLKIQKVFITDLDKVNSIRILGDGGLPQTTQYVPLEV